MPDLSTAERKRLVNILGRLGSDFDGERSAAALLASRMLRERKLTWGDVILRQLPSPEREPAPKPDPSPANWRDDLALALRRASYCRAWEQGFLASVARRHVISPKQRAVLREIADALRERGFA